MNGDCNQQRKSEKLGDVYCMHDELNTNEKEGSNNCNVETELRIQESIETLYKIKSINRLVKSKKDRAKQTKKEQRFDL